MSGGEPAGRSADLVVLRRVPDELTAVLLRGDLESQGIPAAVIGGLTAQLRAEAPGLVSVMVRRCDLARAQEFLTEDALPEGWEDEAERAAREDESDTDGRSPHRSGDL